MSQNGHDAPTGSAPASKKPGNLSVEKMYQKKSQLEHILLRPDTYIGSVEPVTETMWVYDTDKEQMVQREISYVPGLYKIFDEILVNAADNKQRDKTMNCIKITIDPEANVISVWNNGKGIPVVEHKDEKMFVPTMIFGHLLTSSNYNDEEEKVTGGRNGYGAKLCNIFSNSFTVETSSKDYKKAFKQKWTDNMGKAHDVKIAGSGAEDYTKITFSPDLSKFKMTKLDKDIVDLMSRRAFDVAASTRGVKVFLNSVKLPVKNFKDYIDLYIKGKEDGSGNPLKVYYENVNDRWEVAVTVSESGFQQVSFVNSIATTKGGRHVDYVTDALVKNLIEQIKKKNKGGMQLKPFQVKNHMWIFVNALIVNPTFDSQTKEHMTLQVKNFGSKCILSEKFLALIAKSPLVEHVLTWAKFKEQTLLEKAAGGKKKSKLRGIPKLDDANDAGTKNSMSCTLILTEGDSAKALAVSGLGVVGRDKYGVFPLRGKLLNVREATHKQIMENAEINNIIKIMGLQYKKKYETREDMETLRYGKIMIMTDQDQDGSHIKGLIVNFIHHNWPSLIKMPFLEVFITPIVKASKRNEEISFYSIPEFDEWRQATPSWPSYKIKYYKGLGTSTSKEAKEYFSNMERHRIKFTYGGPECDEHIIMAFSKKCVEQRKEWLTNWMVDRKRRQDLGLAEEYLYTKDTRTITFKDFVNKELVLFSNMDNERSIPCMVDGLKPGSRKVLFTCLKRNDKREVKVAQLAGSVAELSAYHHGETSLMSTIINLAQNYVGTNNINLLQPIGQFGTRLQGGKDAASPRYIFTMLSPLARLIFHPNDDPLLKYQKDDNQRIEPVWYIPVIPMVLINGAEGIGTGWMTKIPNYNPREIIGNLKQMISGVEPSVPLTPWYKNFVGEIRSLVDTRYLISGEVGILSEEKIQITELPVGTWTHHYKESVLEPMLAGSEKQPPLINDFKEYHTDTTVKFIVSLARDKLAKAESDGLHEVFKIQTSISLSSMCAFDRYGCLRRYNTVEEIIKEYFELRLDYYGKRKAYMQGMLQAEADKLTDQARFIEEKCDGRLTVENKKKIKMIEELKNKGYKSDPVKEWKQKQVAVGNTDEDEAPAQDEDENSETATQQQVATSDGGLDYDYLLGMTMWTLTLERKQELINKKNTKIQELEDLKAKTPGDLWTDDLQAISEKLDEVEEKERQEEASTGATVAKGKGKGAAIAKKKAKIEDYLPSPKARRVAPQISNNLKKKAETAVKALERKLLGVPKRKKKDDAKDEFDNIEDKANKLSPHTKSKKKKEVDSDEEIVPRQRSERKTKANLSFANLDDSDSDVFNDGNESPGFSDLSDKEVPLPDSSDEEILSAKPKPKPAAKNSSPKEEDSDKLFDSLLHGDDKKPPSGLSSSEEKPKPKPAAKAAKPKAPRAPKQPKEPKKSPEKRRKKKNDDDESSDDMFSSSKKTKKPPKKKAKKFGSSDSDMSDMDMDRNNSPPPVSRATTGRARKPITYQIDSDESDD